MKLFSVTKRSLDFGFGDAPPEWSRWVWANDIDEVNELLKQHGFTCFITVREIKRVGAGLSEFREFLKSKKPDVDHSRQVSLEEVEDFLANMGGDGL